MVRGPHPETWLRVTDQGLYCAPGDFFVDPGRPAARAVVTHGHADHARPGNAAVLATPETVDIMRARYGENAGDSLQAARYGEPVSFGDVTVTLRPAGHVLGSAQAVIEHAGVRVVVSGDYKRRRDPTCPPFELVGCDVFITEATFGLPVFRHPDDRAEIDKLLTALRQFPDRCLLVGAYALGKAQRVICLIREAGYDKPLYLHGALQTLCDLYRGYGAPLGDLLPITDLGKDDLRGEIVLAPPSAARDRWARRLPDPVIAQASGWMRVRQRAKQSGVEVPLVISDHADWDELAETITQVGAEEVWITHGREEALAHFAATRGIRARALSLIGREDEAE